MGGLDVIPRYVSHVSYYCFQINIAVQCLSTDFSSQKGVKVSKYE